VDHPYFHEPLWFEAAPILSPHDAFGVLLVFGEPLLLSVVGSSLFPVDVNYKLLNMVMNPISD
jgi:hypothetical protein